MTDAGPSLGRTSEVVGRDQERARIDTFVAEIPDGARALLIRGDPGIGKTTLWRYALGRSREAGMRVLVARPAEEEMQLALVGLDDLFEGEPLDVSGDGPDEAAVRGRAALAALRRDDRGPGIVLAVDDLQWLDLASARALRYALRRLDADPVGVIATLRSSHPEDPLATLSTLPPGRSQTLDVGALSLETTRRLLDGLGPAVPRPVLRRIHEVSGGNPLYAIELFRSIPDGGADDRWAELSLPASIQAAILRRLDSQPPDLVRVLEVAGALGRPTVGGLRGALPELDVESLLELGERHELIVVTRDLEVRFAHPLIASVVDGRMGPLERRTLHANLVAGATDPDVRARHLALSTDEPNGPVATELEEAAVRATDRGAHDLAAEFAGHAARLTPLDDPDAAVRRAQMEIEARMSTGEIARGLVLADRLASSLPRGPARAETLFLRSYLEDDDREVAEAMLLEALEDAGDDRALRGRILERLAAHQRIQAAGGAAARLLEAIEIADETGDRALGMRARARLAHLYALAGTPRPDIMAEAVALEDAIEGGEVQPAGPRGFLAKQLTWAGDLGAAREMLEADRTDPRSPTNELRRMQILYDRAILECAAGAFDVADELIALGVEGARDTEDPWAISLFLSVRVELDVWSGNERRALEDAREILRMQEGRGHKVVARVHGLLGLLALSQGDPGSALERSSIAMEILEGEGIRHPGAEPVLPNAVEAAAEVGDLSLAHRFLEELDERSEGVDSEWARAVAHRARGIVVLSEGDAEGAAGLLGAAVDRLDRTGHRPDAARAALSQARAILRTGQRTRAAEGLTAARNRFAGMGAVFWTARVDEELERAAPGRSTGTLTVTETRVAELVAQGLRNKEIASQLFISVATVEAHLTRIYRKLDIRSRSALARLVTDGSVPASEPDP